MKKIEFKIKGRAVSMTRLDQLAQPTRRKGEHIRAVIERERQQQIETNLEAERVSKTRKMSRSLTHLSSSSSTRSPAPLRLYQPSSASKNIANNSTNYVRPLRKSNATKSMTQLVTAKLLSTPKTTPTVVQARIAQKHANDTEIDSRTTNVSAGVCSPFPLLTLAPTQDTKIWLIMYSISFIATVNNNNSKQTKNSNHNTLLGDRLQNRISLRLTRLHHTNDHFAHLNDTQSLPDNSELFNY